MSRRTNTTAVTAAVLLSTFLASLDISAVGTAMPTIIGTLGGLNLYSWVFSAYLLTSTTTVPIYGRLADIYGRKLVFSAGALLFLLSSILCGSATSMEQLIAFRAIQGLGAGAILPVSMTVLGDIYPIEQRARVQGLMSAMWGISAILGPIAGGLIVDRLYWGWVFYLNLPFGIISILLFALFLHEKVVRQNHSIDYRGAGALTVAVGLLLLGLMEAGQPGSGLPVPLWATFTLSALFLGLFLWNESRVREPLLPLTLFRNRVVSVSDAANVVIGAVLLGFDSYVPAFVQGVLGGTAIGAGAALAPMSFTWPVGATLSGKWILRSGYRPVVIAGMAIILAGSLLMLAVGRDTPSSFVMFAMAVTGLGMGLGATSCLVSVQTAVGWEQRGVATASVQFFRSMGGAIGVAVMGMLVNSELSRQLSGIQAGQTAGSRGGSDLSAASIILDPMARNSISPDLLEAMRLAFANSLHLAYEATAVAALAGIIIALLFPRGSVQEHSHNGG